MFAPDGWSVSGRALRSTMEAGWGVTPGELAAVRGRLEAFADNIFESLPRKDQRARGECYLRGLMLDGGAKSVQPMAQRLGEVHYQALHHPRRAPGLLASCRTARSGQGGSLGETSHPCRGQGGQDSRSA
jgi:hypothetical protein